MWWLFGVSDLGGPVLSLLLHLHQPDYRDPRTREPTLPWVRLHATRGYRDVPRVIRETGARVTVNLVPSLLDQLDYYAAGGSDAWLRLAAAPPEALVPHEREWLLGHFFVGNPRIFGWFPAFGELRARREAREPFDDAALRDVQVWSQLVWFGWTALQDWPELGELRARGRGYSEADKAHVLAIQAQILRELRGLYQELPEVSASPYYHPILPLLVDTAHAQRAMPGAPDPGFRHPEDALSQLVDGRRRVAEWVGRGVDGVWPSEGSVSPEVVTLIEQAGFRWFASDEEVLARSDRAPGSAGGPGADHHGPWECGRLRGVFRDHALSDRIGFLYADRPGLSAAMDLIKRVDGHAVFCALDGENPWEAYADAGKAFLETLLTRATTGTVGEYAERAPRGRIRQIHTGSWIGADFRIWMGHEEDRTAWRLLAKCRADVEAAGRPQAAMAACAAAEGSDWFWWYGEDFHTPVSAEFDRLFRAHLAEAWRLSGVAPPAELDLPIKQQRAGIEPAQRRFDAPPDATWYTWSAAGRVSVQLSAMAPQANLPRTVEYGAYASQLWVRRVGGAGEWAVEVAGRRAVVSERWAAVCPLPEEAAHVVLWGPAGERLPDVGGWALPIPG